MKFIRAFIAAIALTVSFSAQAAIPQTAGDWYQASEAERSDALTQIIAVVSFSDAEVDAAISNFSTRENEGFFLTIVAKTKFLMDYMEKEGQRNDPSFRAVPMGVLIRHIMRVDLGLEAELR
ncbi:hypothetical protein NX722_26720 [Endozoicomonas gorgoniicola]|uniref:Uncharacterized protein n=1 Tax=Endozoicomonas gorgoniicola TaxID=1234144 RepID=A0ABT3N3F1_9GAMM|nr:hypothetical protein [Endozoicomonas gorgoniicola]MCW7556157.1 hypothetical protein [Endozoicomonas gorgoniicola]